MALHQVTPNGHSRLASPEKGSHPAVLLISNAPGAVAMIATPEAQRGLLS